MKTTISIFSLAFAVSLSPILLSFPTFFYAGYIYTSALICLLLLISSRNQKRSFQLTQQPSFRLDRNPPKASFRHPDPDLSGEGSPHLMSNISTLLLPLIYLLSAYLASLTLAPIHPLAQQITWYGLLHIGALWFWLSEKSTTIHSHRSLLHYPQMLFGVGAGLCLGVFQWIFHIFTLPPSLDWYGALASAIMFALTEELFFRRLLLRRFLSITNAPTALTVMTLLMMGLFSPLNAGGMLFGTIYQTSFAVLYIFSKSLVSPLVAHIISNILLVLLP